MSYFRKKIKVSQLLICCSYSYYSKFSWHCYSYVKQLSLSLTSNKSHSLFFLFLFKKKKRETCSMSLAYRAANDNS